MGNTERWGKRKKNNEYDANEEETMIELHEMDLYYDQPLLEIKRLVNERERASPRNKNAYNLAIYKAIDDIRENMHDIIPKKDMDRDIEDALMGGRYHKLYYDPTDDSNNEHDIINLGRKKRPSKVRPNRKPVKKSIKKVVKRRK
jgi:hypothetical protein